MVHLIEFWDYLVQFLVCTAGFIGAARQFLKSRRQPYVLLACFFWTYALGTLYWTLDRELYLPADDGDDPAVCRRTALSDEIIVAGACYRCAAVYSLYYLR